IFGKGLAICAGAGFRPTLQHGWRQAVAGDHFLETDAPLVLEGLELIHIAGVGGKKWSAAVYAKNAPALQVANCRFLVTGDAMGLACWFANQYQIRNC